jgi:PIN domain nuclease of toxin-antitoxin system
MVTVDTYILIWQALKPEFLSKKARQNLENADNNDGILICNISLWEIAMLMQKGRLEVDVPYLDLIDLIKASHNYIFQPITPEIAYKSTRLLTEITADPADRLIAATSIVMTAPLITADNNLRGSSAVKTVW